MAVVCPRCGEENPEQARYCMACTEPLIAAAPAREERKVVSVLFVDLVGFTAASEAADPEDVRARLQRYHARAKAQVERFGGTIEKFVGDAVMAVFGAPVAHEDDAERAVRAGLAILEAMEELELEARGAVNTGEAVVALEARPELGEGIVTGDVVNTAARLQSSAPPGGEPGIGKSRLVAELRDHVDAQPELVYWRQGRCLPYGEGIALWAFGEIVKAQAGILESDDPEMAREKLAAAVEPLVPTAPEQAWIVGELARVVGAGEGSVDREESFAAWRAFLESVAAQRPLVVVVEDLHWADPALLEFLEHLVDWSSGVPLLVLCTARPELHELHPTWSGGKRNATTISLSPLSGGDTARVRPGPLRPPR